MLRGFRRFIAERLGRGGVAAEPSARIRLGGEIRPTGRLELLHQRRREIDARDAIEIGTNEKVEALKSQGREVVGIRVEDSEGTSLAGDILSDGQTLSYEIRGRSRQNEQGTEPVCQILVDHLNEAGSHWGRATQSTGREEGVDCFAADCERRLQIQLTRAEQDPTFWEKFASSRSTRGLVPLSDAVATLQLAIERKTRKATGAQRRELVLALDATETAAYALDAVAAAFRAKHGDWARDLDYYAIWLVGPNSRLTHRLDHP